jgi:PIN domain nuclease of toxin-antitoxin system
MAVPGSTVVLDASAVVALLLDEPGAEAVESHLMSASARISTVNAAETVDVLTRVHHVEPDHLATQFEDLLSAVTPVSATVDVAMRAGELRARHWRRDQRVSLADCFALATAEAGDRIVTTDRTLAAVARDEGHEVVELG